MSENKHSLRSVVRKILAAFLLGSVAIVLAVAIARFSFRELMGTVDQLSEPNEKLLLLNTLFEKITTLDQVQRAQAIENPKKPFSTFLDQSVAINQMIDSLKTLSWDTAQQNKLDAMKGILNDRNQLFFSYLKVKAELMENKEFSIQLDTLALILADDEITLDTTLITSRKKITTTFFRDSTKNTKADQRSFIRKLFSKKKPVSIDTPKIKVREEQQYVVDTMALARQLSALNEIENIMRAMETDQRNQRKRLQRQELELINANSQLINELLNILHTVENEELASMRRTNDHAVSVMNQSISRINVLMLSFFLAAALLVYLIWIDIGKSNYYKEQLERERDRAEELTQIKQRFLANMSHEIRTPLQSIIGFAEQLKLKSASRHEELDAIYSSSEHLLHIVNEVLDYSRISSGNFTLSHERFRLLHLIKEVEAAMRIQAERKNLTFILDTEKAGEFTVNGDPFRLRQILYNVIGNAIKFTHRGFIKLSVKTRDEGGKVFCIFEVIDSGIGIEKKDIDKIFNQFEQANTSITKTYGGTGLGLSIVKSLVEAQHGQVELSSEVGIGTSFRIDLAFEKAPSSLTKPATQMNEATQQFSGKVMVIDDDSLILRLCSLILKQNKIDYITYNHGRTLLNEGPDPDVTHVFMDIRMPDINGVELCKALRKKYPASTKFIALTAHVLPEEKDSLLKEGFSSILTKPFHEHELIGMLGITMQSVHETTNDEQPNLSLLRQMTMGDEALFQSIVAQFVEETMEDVVRIKEILSKHDGKALREVVHKMAGRFAQLGMSGLSSKLQSVEKQLVAGSSAEDVSVEMNHLSKKVNETVIQIRLTTMEQLN